MRGPLVAAVALGSLSALGPSCTPGGSADQSTSVVISERAPTYRGVGLGSSTDEVERVFGQGETEGGVAPADKSPAEVGVPLVLPTPSGAWHGWPWLLRYEDAVFLIARDQVYAMMLTNSRLRTSRGVGIGDDIQEVRRRYRGVRCRQVAGGESLSGAQNFYPVCHIQVRRHQVLFFGGDPIRSFTFHTRRLVGD